MRNFCYKCGKIADKNTLLINNLCQKCYIELHPLLKFPHPLVIKLCKKCNRYYLKNQWISSHFEGLEFIIENAIKQIIPYQLEISPQTELEITSNVIGNLERILKMKSITIDIKARGRAYKTFELYTENYNSLKVSLNITVCISCLSLKRGIYQAVLHVLTPDREILDYERDLIFSIVEKESLKVNKFDKLAYISKFIMKKGKMTFFIGSEKFARSLAALLSYNLGGFLKMTYKFGSRKIPKEVKRNKLYISLYLLSFVDGDLLWVNNNPLYVTKISGNRVMGINLITYEKFKMPLKVLKKVKILLHSSDLRSFLYFSQTNETIQFIDLENYQIFEIPKSSKYSELDVGKYIKGFEVDGQLFLIPD